MAKALVKCPYCKEQFDRNSVPFIKVGRRYAHVQCQKDYEANGPQEEKDKAAMYEYISQAYGKKYNYVLIKRQVDNYLKKGMTYKEITLCLKWFYDIAQNPVGDAKGIGIVPYIYKDAKAYYQMIAKAKAANAQIHNYKAKDIKITVSAPAAETQKIQLWEF